MTACKALRFPSSLNIAQKRALGRVFIVNGCECQIKQEASGTNTKFWNLKKIEIRERERGREREQGERGGQRLITDLPIIIFESPQHSSFQFSYSNFDGVGGGLNLN